MDFEAARYNMIEQQIRPWDVLELRILELMGSCPREKFVPQAFEMVAYADTQIPLGHDCAMLQPKVAGRLLQELKLRGNESVLEVGTGSGYLTTLLSQLARSVTSVEVQSGIHKQAQDNLNKIGVSGIELLCKNIFEFETAKTYDVVVVTGSLPDNPQVLAKFLNSGGKLFITLGKGPLMNSYLFERRDGTSWHKKLCFQTEVEPLQGIPETAQFEL